MLRIRQLAKLNNWRGIWKNDVSIPEGITLLNVRYLLPQQEIKWKKVLRYAVGMWSSIYSYIGYTNEEKSNAREKKMPRKEFELLRGVGRDSQMYFHIGDPSGVVVL